MKVRSAQRCHVTPPALSWWAIYAS